MDLISFIASFDLSGYMELISLCIICVKHIYFCYLRGLFREHLVAVFPLQLKNKEISVSLASLETKTFFYPSTASVIHLTHTLNQRMCSFKCMSSVQGLRLPEKEAALVVACQVWRSEFSKYFKI